MAQAKYIKAYYTDDDQLIHGLKNLKKQGVKILDVLTPFPVHGLDKVLGYRRSWIARVGFIGGAIGAASGFLFQAWVFTRAYPLNIGGKPFLAVPSFIPVTFECTVLFAAFAMVFAFLFRSKLGPGADPIIHDEKITDDRFLVLVGAGDDTSGKNATDISKSLKESGAKGITVKDDVDITQNY